MNKLIGNVLVEHLRACHELIAQLLSHSKEFAFPFLEGAANFSTRQDCFTHKPNGRHSNPCLSTEIRPCASEGSIDIVEIGAHYADRKRLPVPFLFESLPVGDVV